MRAFIKKVPVPIAGLALGLVALGNLLQPYNATLQYLFAGLSLITISLLVARIILHPRTIKGDMRSSVFASVFGTFFMTFMQLSAVLAQWNTRIAFVLWTAATLGHLAWIGWFTKTYIFKFHLDEVFPTYFIAYVGIIVASVTSSAFSMQAVGEVLFWFGLACYAVLLVVVTARYAKHDTPEPTKPLFCIYAAPMSLSLAGYLTCASNINTVMVVVMAVLAQLLLVVVLLQLPRLLKLRFYPSYAAMTFPFVITATALGKTLTYLGEQGFPVPSVITLLYAVETAFAVIMVCYVALRYVGFFKDVVVGLRDHKQFGDLERSAQHLGATEVTDAPADASAPSALPATN